MIESAILNEIKLLWRNIASFEKGEVKNDSKDHLLSLARTGARMEAYTKLFELKLDEYYS